MPIPNFSETIDQFREALKTPASAAAKLMECTEKMRAFLQERAHPLPEETLFLASELALQLFINPNNFFNGAGLFPDFILTIQNLIEELKRDEANKEALHQQLDCGKELTAPHFYPRFVLYLLLLEKILAAPRPIPSLRAEKTETTYALAKIAFYYAERMPSIEEINVDKGGSFAECKLSVLIGETTIFELLVRVAQNSIDYCPKLAGVLSSIVAAFYIKNPTFFILPHIFDSWVPSMVPSIEPRSYPTASRSYLAVEQDKCEKFIQFSTEVIANLYPTAPSPPDTLAFEGQRFTHLVMMLCSFLRWSKDSINPPQYSTFLNHLTSLLAKHLDTPAACAHISGLFFLSSEYQQITGEKTTSLPLSWLLASSLGFSIEKKTTGLTAPLLAIALKAWPKKKPAYTTSNDPDVCYAWMYALRMTADSKQISNEVFHQFAAIIISQLTSLEPVQLKTLLLAGNGAHLPASKHEYRLPFSQGFRMPDNFDRNTFHRWDREGRAQRPLTTMDILILKSISCNTLHRLLELVAYTVLRRNSPMLLMQLLTLARTVIQLLLETIQAQRKERAGEIQTSKLDPDCFGLLGCLAPLMRAFCVISNRSRSDQNYAQNYSECHDALFRLLIDCSLCCEQRWFFSSVHLPPNLRNYSYSLSRSLQKEKEAAMSVAPKPINEKLPESDWQHYWDTTDWRLSAYMGATTISPVSDSFNSSEALSQDASITHEVKQYIVEKISALATEELEHCLSPGAPLACIIDHRRRFSFLGRETTFSREQVETLMRERRRDEATRAKQAQEAQAAQKLASSQETPEARTRRTLALLAGHKPRASMTNSDDSLGSSGTGIKAPPTGQVVAAAAAAQVVAATAAAARPMSPGLFSAPSAPPQGEDGVGVELTIFNPRLPGQPSNGKSNG